MNNVLARFRAQTVYVPGSGSGGGGGIVWVTPPATSTSPGTAGQVAYDANYFYTCVATDTWVRAPLSDWS